MSIEELAKQSREEKRQQFGEIGLHDDCVNYGTLNGNPFCNACSYWKDSQNSRKAKIIPCEKHVCYFYEPKRKEDVND